MNDDKGHGLLVGSAQKSGKREALRGIDYQQENPSFASQTILPMGWETRTGGGRRKEHGTPTHEGWGGLVGCRGGGGGGGVLGAGTPLARDKVKRVANSAARGPAKMERSKKGACSVVCLLEKTRHCRCGHSTKREKTKGTKTMQGGERRRRKMERVHRVKAEVKADGGSGNEAVSSGDGGREG